MNKETYLGTYRLIRKLGQGGTSKVYLAYDPFKDIEVAIKIIKQEFLDDRDWAGKTASNWKTKPRWQANSSIRTS